jgi:predicted methyltransferase
MYKIGLKRAILATFVVGCVAVGQNVVAFEDVNKAALSKALDAGHRSAGNVKRDKYRHPEGTISFFNISQDMVVGEIWPGGAGFYAEILAPYLKDEGAYHPITRDLETAGSYAKGVHTLKAKFAANPSYGPYAAVDMSKENPDIGMKGQFDMILTFRNVHNWSMGKYDGPFIKAINTALKMGGKVGVVDHRLDGSVHEAKEINGGYMATAYMVKLFEANGFKLSSSSEVNANPKDNKDHPSGVWTLPPSLSKKDEDRAKYLAIGESDRMTLLFEKVSN